MKTILLGRIIRQQRFFVCVCYWEPIARHASWTKSIAAFFNCQKLLICSFIYLLSLTVFVYPGSCSDLQMDHIYRNTKLIFKTEKKNLSYRNETVWKFHITIIATKVVMVIIIIMVSLTAHTEIISPNLWTIWNGIMWMLDCGYKLWDFSYLCYLDRLIANQIAFLGLIKYSN